MTLDLSQPLKSCSNKEKSFWSLWDNKRNFIAYEKELNELKNYIENVTKVFLENILPVEKIISEGRPTIYYRVMILTIKQYDHGTYFSVLGKNLRIAHALAFISLLHKELSDMVERNKNNEYIEFDDDDDYDDDKLQILLVKTLQMISELVCVFVRIECNVTSAKEKVNDLYNNTHFGFGTKTTDLRDLMYSLEELIEKIVKIYLGFEKSVKPTKEKVFY